MEIKEIFKKNNIVLSEEQEEKFFKYYDFLASENQKYNLTAITSREDVFYKHFLDSVLPESEITKNANIIDIGSGAGFPAVPLKIVRPDLKFTLVDSLNKRVNFLTQLFSLLDLSDIKAVHARAEDFIKENRESYDFAVARAVAPLNTLLEYMVPYLKIGGRCLIYKSQKMEEEIKEAKKAMEILSVRIVKVLEYELGDATRKILIVEKLEKTNEKYPRGKNLPKLKPL